MQDQTLQQANIQQIRRITEILDWPQLTDRVCNWLEGRSASRGHLTDIWPCFIVKAAGGDPLAAIPLASVWTLYRLASRMFDDMVDGDCDPNPMEMSLTHSIFLLANMCLADYDVPGTGLKNILADLSQTWAFGFRSLVTPRDLSLEQYFQYRIANDAALYVTIAKAAMIGTDVDEQTAAALQDHAFQVGLTAAIANDCTDIRAVDGKRSDLENAVYTLPALYVLEEQPDLIGQPDAILQALETSDALQRARDVAASCATNAIKALASIDPSKQEDLVRYVTG